MWRQICARLDILIAPSIERRLIESKGCAGLACKASDEIAENEIVAVVPCLACTSPINALASPWGAQLSAGLGTYAMEDKGVRVEYPREGALTTAFTALAMQPRSPLEHYLQFIELPDDGTAGLEAALGPALMEKAKAIDALNAAALERMRADLLASGLDVPLANLRRAHAICSSRCVDVPGGDKMFGGPALVPVVDLINHDSRPPNVAIYAESTLGLAAQLRRHSRIRVPSSQSLDDYPLCVLMRATQPISGGEELTYQYVEAAEDPRLYADKLYWASRFRFLPQDLPQAVTGEESR